MSKRFEQKELRKQLIIYKSLELFVKKGYAETKISDIAKEANMSVGLLFHYFSSKEQLYEELIKICVNGTNYSIQMNFSNPLEYFQTFIDLLIEYSKENPMVFYMFILMSQARRSDGIPRHIKELALSVNQIEQSAKIIEQGQKEGYFKEGDPHAISFIFWSSVQGIMEQLSASNELLLADKIDTNWIIDIIRRNK